MTIPAPFHQAIRTAAAILADKWRTPLDGAAGEVHIWAIVEAYGHHMVQATIGQIPSGNLDWDAIAEATGHPTSEHARAACGHDEPPF
jgi:hypothetical protein